MEQRDQEDRRHTQDLWNRRWEVRLERSHSSRGRQLQQGSGLIRNRRITKKNHIRRPRMQQSRREEREALVVEGRSLLERLLNVKTYSLQFLT